MCTGQRSCRRSGKKLRPHAYMLRHTFAIEKLNAGASLEDVSLLLSHHSVKFGFAFPGAAENAGCATAVRWCFRFRTPGSCGQQKSRPRAALRVDLTHPNVLYDTSIGREVKEVICTGESRDGWSLH